VQSGKAMNVQHLLEIDEEARNFARTVN